MCFKVSHSWSLTRSFNSSSIDKGIDVDHDKRHTKNDDSDFDQTVTSGSIVSTFFKGADDEAKRHTGEFAERERGRVVCEAQLGIGRSLVESGISRVGARKHVEYPDPASASLSHLQEAC